MSRFEAPYRRSQSIMNHSEQHRGTPVLEDQHYFSTYSPPPNIRRGTRGVSGGFVAMDNGSIIRSSIGKRVITMSLTNVSATAHQQLISTPRAAQNTIVRVINEDVTQQFRRRSMSVVQGRFRWSEVPKVAAEAEDDDDLSEIQYRRATGADMAAHVQDFVNEFRKVASKCQSRGG
ncbi:unnamed protein product [Hyaloperonospora brassicae]|uniref:Uncharacterized protein n=1 Tax=Hyaloperonospora brassicae TaxID=162125 RepID=A0AAV0USS5_HYABA|nr:unnamed protein product [Hyaloperonospora brassicae]